MLSPIPAGTGRPPAGWLSGKLQQKKTKGVCEKEGTYP